MPGTAVWRQHGNQKRKHRQWRYIKKRLLIVLVFLVVVFAAIFVSVGINMNPAALSLAEARVTALTSTALNESILESMSKDEVYAQLISMNNTSSNVYMLHADTVKMNTLAASSSEAAQKRIAEIGEQGIAIPIGTLTNIPFLAGVGPDIRVKFEPAGSVVSEFKSELKSAGINQTLYRVKVRLTASLKLILPSVWEDITVSAEIAVAEGVIVGDVPQVYTNVANEEDMLNLIPTEIQ